MKKLSKEEVFSFFTNNGVIVNENEDYVGVDHRHNVSMKCGHKHKVSLTSFKRNMNANNGIYRCPICKKQELSDDRRKTKEEISEFVNSIEGYKFVSLHNFESSRKGNIKILHQKCGQEFEMSFSNFQQGKRCVHCYRRDTASKMTSLTVKLLQQRGIKYEVEKTYHDLKNPFSNKRLRYDFFIPSLNVLIEIDGKQHHKATNLYGGESKLIETRYRDYLKNKYALKKGIRLYRIEYIDSKTGKHKNIATIESEVYNLIFMLDRELKEI